jgi:two-component system response regulator YesN
MNVLLVDDEPIVLEQLAFLIQPLCPLWKLYPNNDGSQALHLCKKVEFQLAFLDIEMPGKSGLELAIELKSMYKDIKIVIITAHQEFKYAKEAISIGVDHFLTKPIIESELKEVIHKHAKNIDYIACSRLISDALSVIHNKYQEKLSLSMVANAVHTNPSYLSRKFSDEVGVSFSDYLIDYRVEVAKTLLRSGELTISQISERVGFNTLHYFSAIFKRKVGVTAKAFREMETR